MSKNSSEKPTAKSAGDDRYQDSRTTAPNNSSAQASSTNSAGTFTREPGVTRYAPAPDGGPPNEGMPPGTYRHKVTGEIKTVGYPPLAPPEGYPQPYKPWPPPGYISNPCPQTFPPPNLSPWQQIDRPPPPYSASSTQGQKDAHGGNEKGSG